MKKKILIISGPTASGKSGLGLYLAKEVDGVIINADSMQIYKGLPILSAQPTEEEQKEIEHLLYSHFEPTENCSVGIWLELIQKAIEGVFTKNKTPIVVGGTGMYVDKLINGLLPIPDISSEVRKKATDLFNKIGYEKFYEKTKKIDEESVLKLNKNDKQRLIRIYEVYEGTGKKLSEWQKLPNEKIYEKEQLFHINLRPPRDLLYEKCNNRFEKMLDKGGFEEVENFIKKYPGIACNLQNYPIGKTIGLLEVIQYFNDEIDKEELVRHATKKTRNYAKRQYTWYKNQFKEEDMMIINEMLTKNNVQTFVKKIMNVLSQ